MSNTEDELLRAHNTLKSIEVMEKEAHRLSREAKEAYEKYIVLSRKATQAFDNLKDRKRNTC